MLCLPTYLPNFFYTHTMEAASEEVWNGNQNNCYNSDGYWIPEIWGFESSVEKWVLRQVEEGLSSFFAKTFGIYDDFSKALKAM